MPASEATTNPETPSTASVGESPVNYISGSIKPTGNSGAMTSRGVTDDDTCGNDPTDSLFSGAVSAAANSDDGEKLPASETASAANDCNSEAGVSTYGSQDGDTGSGRKSALSGVATGFTSGIRAVGSAAGNVLSNLW